MSLLRSSVVWGSRYYKHDAPPELIRLFENRKPKSAIPNPKSQIPNPKSVVILNNNLLILSSPHT